MKQRPHRHQSEMRGMAEKRQGSAGLVDDNQGSEEERKNHSCDGIAFHGWSDERGPLLGESKPLEVAAVKRSSRMINQPRKPRRSELAVAKEHPCAKFL